MDGDAINQDAGPKLKRTKRLAAALIGAEPGLGRAQTWRALTWLGLVLACLVGMGQAGALVQEATSTGEFSVTTLYGPGQLLSSFTATTNALNAWGAASTQFSLLPAWLYLHLVFDVLFIAGYGLLGFSLLPSTEWLARRLLAALITADAVEDLIAAAAFARVAAHRDALLPLTVALHLATMIKWLAALAFLVRVAYRAWDSDRARGAIRHVLSALWEQRFSVIVVALLAVMAAGRGADVLEQMPDVQRAWLTWPPGTGWVHAALAATAQLLLAALLVFLGRMRTRRAEEKFSGADRRADPSYVPWIAVPAVLAVLAVALRLPGAAEISWWRLGVAIAVPSVIAVSSAAIRWSARRRRRPRAVEGPGQERVVIAVTGVGLVRSFAAPGLLADDGYTAASWIAVAVGIAVATAIWRLADGPGREYLRGQADRLIKPDQQRARQSRPGPLPYLADWARQGRVVKGRPGKKGSGLWPWLVVGAPFLIADVCLLFVPLWATHWLGVLATAVVAVSTLAVVLAVLAYLAQTRRPLPLFRMIRLNVTPVITIIAVIGLVGGLADSRPLVHQVRGPVSPAEPADRTSLLASLQNWLADPDTAACAIPAAGTIGAARPVRVEPFILAAAAGGGVRAAWWAERALADLAATRCGQHDVFAVSSVSGGSLGMAILDTASPAQARAYMSDIAGPDALAAGVDGLLLHDLIAGYTGLDLPAAQLPPGQKFSDRAGLIESAWQNQDGELKLPFPLRHPALPWRLLFNSTTAGTGCRAIIADRSLPTEPSTPSGPSLTCDLRSSVPGGGSYDFFAELPCMQDIATVTAAMLSARFPYITPSGVVTCPGQHGVLTGQFVDGGYVDSSGLITLADLMPSLIQALQVHNATAVSQAQPGQPVTLVVPVVVYLGNSPRPVPVTSVLSLIQEPFVPLDANSAAASELLVSDTLLQRLRGMIGNGRWLQCSPATPGCAAAEAAAEKTIPDQIFFVSPHTQPRISAPLGWVLSAASRKSLDTALSQEEYQGCLQVSPPAPCKSQPGVGLMADLLQLIQRQ